MSLSQYVRFDNDGIELVINLESGESFASFRGYARMAGIEASTVTKRVKRDGIVTTLAEVPTPKGLREVQLINKFTLVSWLSMDYHKTGDPQLLRVLNHIMEDGGAECVDQNLYSAKKAKISPKKKERALQIKYKNRLGGQTEVPVASGRIDLLTDDTIYEFKIFRDYKNCLGQLLAYEDCLPGLKLCAVLFDTPKALLLVGEDCKRITRLFNKHGAEVEFLS